MKFEMFEEEVRKSLSIRKLIEIQIGGKDEVTEEEAKTYYDEIKPNLMRSNESGQVILSLYPILTMRIRNLPLKQKLKK